MSHDNGVMLQSFTWTPDDSGRFWQDLGGRAQELRDAGFTAVWMPPATKGQGGAEDVGYGMYDLYDLGEFDQKGSVRTRYGTRQQFEDCVAELKRSGLLTLSDIVLNHRMGGDETERFLAVKVDEEDRLTTESEPIELEGWTRFNFPGRGGKYSEFCWRWHHFNALDHEDHEAAGEGEGDGGDGEGGGSTDGGGEPTRSIYRIFNKDFADDVGQEMGNYDYLMGCNHHLQQEDVRQELMRWSRWMLEATGVDGFRIDAAKHMSERFLRDMVAELPHDADDQPRFAVAEYAVDDVAAICDFVRDTDGLIHAFDFPLHYRFAAAAREGMEYDLRDLFHDTMSSECPDLAVTFVDNHDTEPAQGGDNFVGGIFKGSAYACILLRQGGFPCVFIGDYDGRSAPPPDHAPDSANEQIPQMGDGDGDASEDRNDHAGEPGDGVPDLENHGELLRRLIELRQRYNYGDQHDTFIDPNRIGWLRTGDQDHPESMVVIVSNGPAEPLEIETYRPETTFTNVFDPGQTVETDGQGMGQFTGPEDGFVVWVTGSVE